MKFVVLIALALGAAFFYPERHEQTATACAALEKRLLPPGSTPTGAAAAVIHDMIPFLPPEAGCAVGYWLVIAKPDLADALRAGMIVKPPVK